MRLAPSRPSTHIMQYEGKVKSFRPNLRETRDNLPLGREPERRCCNRHTTNMIKLFLSQTIAISGSIRARWKVLGLAYNRRGTRDKQPLGRDPDRSWCHRPTNVKHFGRSPRIHVLSGNTLVCYRRGPWSHGLRPKNIYTSVAVTSAPFWVPIQQPVVLGFT